MTWWNPIWKKIKEYAKTLWAAAAGLVGAVIISLIQGETPWPQNGKEWLQLVIVTFGPAIATAIARNKITQKQIDKDPNVIGGVVVDKPPVVTTDILGVRNNVPPAVGGGLYG